MFAFLFAIVSAIVAVVSGVRFARMPKSLSPREMHKRKALQALALTAGFCVCIGLGISTAFTAVNVVLTIVFAAYYVRVVVASFALRPRYIAIIVGSVLSAPIVLCAITFPISLVVFADHFTSGSERRTAGGFICRMTLYGFVGSDSGSTFTILQPLAFGLLRREVYRDSRSDVTLDDGPTSDDERCAFDANNYRLGPSPSLPSASAAHSFASRPAGIRSGAVGSVTARHTASPTSRE